MIWKRKPTVEALNSFNPNTMGGHIGLEFTEVGDDYLKATLPVDHRTIQPYGLIHGGANVVLAETLGSVAGGLCVDFPEYGVVGVEVNANHVRSARSGKVEGIVTPIKVGSKIHVWEIKIYNEKKALTCVSRLTLAVIRLNKGK